MNLVNDWYVSITCKGECRRTGEVCQKGHIWVGPPETVVGKPKVVKEGRFTDTWRVGVHAEARLKVMCECGKPRRRKSGKIIVE
jgi:hypothetical protein